MKYRNWIAILLGIVPALGCAAVATDPVPLPGGYSCEPGAVGFAMTTEREVLAALGTSARREAALMLQENPPLTQQEAIADTLLSVHKEDRAITEQILAEEQALRNQAGTPDPGTVAERYAQIGKLRSQLIQSNAKAVGELQKMSAKADASAQSMQPRMMGGLPMMNVMWCIGFCSGQADALCNGGADLKCWRRQFLRCARLCY